MNGELVVFDLDGVLIDSREANCEAFRYGLEQIGLPAPGDGQVEDLIGLPAVEMLERLGCPQDRCEAVYIDLVAPFYVEHLPRLARPVSEAARVLEGLRDQGLRIGACTSGDLALQEAALRAVGLREYIQEIQTPCGSEFRKPDPRYLGELVDRFGPASRVYHVEDTGHGLEMGRRYGAVTIFAAYGYGSPGPQLPDYVLQRLVDLPGVLERDRLRSS
ncbi:MAG: HAD family hydrolase [Armatimonadetes bacterium]|nr:HAD family hydrolase [Armatimonadota bacterium]